jgi:hypothetical protein
MKILRRKQTTEKNNADILETDEILDEDDSIDAESVSNLSPALRNAMLAKQKRKEEGIVEVRKTPVERWELEKTSIRRSVNAKCYQCNGEENYVNRARFCNVFDCALWFVRPFGKGITQEQCRNYIEGGQ